MLYSCDSKKSQKKISIDDIVVTKTLSDKGNNIPLNSIAKGKSCLIIYFSYQNCNSCVELLLGKSKHYASKFNVENIIIIANYEKHQEKYLKYYNYGDDTIWILKSDSNIFSSHLNKNPLPLVILVDEWGFAYSKFEFDKSNKKDLLLIK